MRKSYSYRDPIDRQFDEEAEVYSNYKMVQGINTPYATVRMENGDMSNQRFVNKVSYNTGVAESLFVPSGLLFQQPKPDAAKPNRPRRSSDKLKLSCYRWRFRRPLDGAEARSYEFL